MQASLPQADTLKLLSNLYPADYFKGVSSRNLCLAENVVVFLRRDREVLNQRNFESRPHHRHVLILTFATHGSVSVDGSVYHLEPGQAFLVAPFQFHFYLDLPEPDIAWLFLTFETPNPNALAPLANLPLRLPPELLDSAVSIARQYDKRDHATQTQVNELLLATSLFLTRLRALAESGSSGILPPLPPTYRQTSDLIPRINRILHERLSEGIGIQDMATRLNRSESYLRRRFRQLTGLSLGSYIVHYKLNRAVKQLVHSNSTLTEIAVDCGYESLAAFSRSFKRQLGLTPSEYRKRGSSGEGV